MQIMSSDSVTIKCSQQINLVKEAAFAVNLPYHQRGDFYRHHDHSLGMTRDSCSCCAVWSNLHCKCPWYHPGNLGPSTPSPYPMYSWVSSWSIIRESWFWVRLDLRFRIKINSHHGFLVRKKSEINLSILKFPFLKQTYSILIKLVPEQFHNNFLFGCRRVILYPSTSSICVPEHVSSTSRLLSRIAHPPAWFCSFRF